MGGGDAAGKDSFFLTNKRRLIGRVTEDVEARATQKNVMVTEVGLSFGVSGQTLSVYGWEGRAVNKLKLLRRGQVVEMHTLTVKKQESDVSKRRGTFYFKCLFNDHSSLTVLHNFHG